MTETTKTYRTRKEAIEAGMQMAQGMELGYSFYAAREPMNPNMTMTTQEIYREVEIMRTPGRRYYPVLRIRDSYTGNRGDRRDLIMEGSESVGTITDNPERRFRSYAGR